MLQNAVDQISEIINLFPIVYKIAIHEKEKITIYYDEKGMHNEKTFNNAIDLLDWCERNFKKKSAV